MVGKKETIEDPEWVKYPTEFVKKTPFGDIVIKKKEIKNWSTDDWWAVKEGETWKKCPKYDILVNGCSKYFECDGCLGRKKVPKKIVKKKRVGKKIKKVTLIKKRNISISKIQRTL